MLGGKGDAVTRRRILILGALCLSLPEIARGQAGAKYCSSQVYNETAPAVNAGPVERMHPLVSRSRYAEPVLNEQWELALRGLRLDALEAFVAGGIDRGQQVVFLAQLDSVLEVLPRLPLAIDSAARARFIAGSIRTDRFRPVQGVDSYTLFRRAERIDAGALGDDQARTLCWSAMSVDLVLFRLGQSLDLGALARLARLTTAWSNYRTYGYTRQPFELFLRPGSVHDTLPPTGQWLIGHLSAGQELRGTRADSLIGNTSTVVEAGHLWYRNNYTQYAGVSGILSVVSGRTVGYGLMLHVARSLRGGAVFRRSEGAARTSFVVSTDLYGLLAHSKKSVEQGLAVARGIVVLPSR